jgi:hypothetical protein
MVRVARLETAIASAEPRAKVTGRAMAIPSPVAKLMAVPTLNPILKLLYAWLSSEARK